MIVGTFALTLLLALGLALFWTRFTLRTASDVLPFLRKIEMELIYGTFHPEAEEQLRTSLPADEFKKMQWKRFHLAIHYCKDMAHNACICDGWARHERKESWNQMSAGVQNTVQELRIACIQVRMSSFVIRTRLRWWLLRAAILPFLPLPSFEELLRVGSADMISFYEKMKQQAELFSMAYGEEYHDKLVEAM
jgi:hypothetical protein